MNKWVQKEFADEYDEFGYRSRHRNRHDRAGDRFTEVSESPRRNRHRPKRDLRRYEEF